MTGGRVLERDDELALLEGLIASASGGLGALAVIEGPAGIGKTRLLGLARARARAARLTVLSARGGVLDRQQPFGVARRLLQPAVARRGAGGKRAQAVTGSPAALGDPDAAATELFATIEALCAIVASAAERAPLVMCVDDAHWADGESLSFFVHLANRLEQLSVLLVLAARPRAPDADHELLAELASDPSAVVLRPAPLSEAAVERWIAAGLGATPGPGFAAACVDATGGNPFLVTELLRTILSERMTPTAANVQRVAGFAPEGVARAVFARLARLPARARDVARALAVLGGRADGSVLAELTQLGHEELAGSIDALIFADVLAKSEPPEFLHPIIRSAVYEDLTLSERDAMHLRAARLLATRAPPELDAVAAHLMSTRSRGEQWIAEQLAHAATQALQRGAPDTASRYLRRALAEPPVPSDVVALLVALGDADAARGQPAAAVTALTEALARITEPLGRAQVARALGKSLVRADRGVEAVQLLLDTVDALPADAIELGLGIEADLEVVAHFDAHAGRKLAGRRARFSARRGAARSDNDRLALAGRADHEMNRGTAGEAAGFARLALDGVELLHPDGPDPMFFFSTAIALLYSDHLDDAERVYSDAITSAEQRKQTWAAAVASGFRAGVHYRRGALAAAETDARFSLANQPEPGLRLGNTFAAGFLIDTLLERGEPTRAVQVAKQVGAEAVLPEALISNLIQHARGRLRAAQLDHAGALADYLECERRALEWDMRTPAVANWSASAAHALAALGRREEALARARAGLDAARAFGSPRAIGMALTTVGQITADTAALQAAIAVLRASPARLELARALVALGTALRHERQRARARAPLAEGLRIARACGGTPLAAQAHQELAATGSRPRKILRAGADALTPSELRVAQLAAAGQSNREIAHALTLSIRTIETHLARGYQKLDITSRRQLAATLAAQPAVGPLNTTQAKPEPAPHGPIG